MLDYAWNGLCISNEECLSARRSMVAHSSTCRSLSLSADRGVEGLSAADPDLLRLFHFHVAWCHRMAPASHLMRQPTVMLELRALLLSS